MGWFGRAASKKRKWGRWLGQGMRGAGEVREKGGGDAGLPELDC